MALKARKGTRKNKSERTRAKKRKITLSAYKATFLIDEPDVSFEAVIRRIYDSAGGHGDNTFTNDFNGNSTTISKFRVHPQNDGIGLTLSTYEKDSEISTLDFTSSTEELTPSSQGAQSGQEFLRENISMLVSENTVLFAALGNNKTQIESALNRIAMSKDIISSSNMVGFSKIAAKDTLEQILEFGIKYLEIDATSLLGSTSEQTSSNTFNRAFGNNGVNQNSVKTRRENSAKLRILSKSRTSKTLTVEALEHDRNEWLDSVGVAAVRDEAVDDYVIKLNNNTTIKPSEIHLKKTVTVQADATTYSLDEAHKALLSYYQEIAADVQRKD